MAMARCRRVTAITILATLAFTQACATYRDPRGAPAAGSRVRVTSTTPILVHEGGYAEPSAAQCEVTAVEGTVERSNGDTLTLRKIRRISLDGRAASCSRTHGVTMLVGPGATDVRVRRISATRTTLLVLGLVLIVALSTTHVETEGGSCPECIPIY